MAEADRREDGEESWEVRVEVTMQVPGQLYHQTKRERGVERIISKALTINNDYIIYFGLWEHNSLQEWLVGKRVVSLKMFQ